MTTETVTVEIPADVRDNNTHTIRFQWRGTVPEVLTAEDLIRARTTFGYIVSRWDDTDKTGRRVTLTRMDQGGKNVWFYGTYYYTRVACLTGCLGYARHYASITDQDGVTTVAAPYCGDCLDFLSKSARGSGMTLNLSEPLLIGQHD